MKKFVKEFKKYMENEEYDIAYEKLKEQFLTSLNTREIENNRVSELIKLMKKYENLNLDAKLDGVTRGAFLTEIANNMAHIFESLMRSDTKNRSEYKEIKSLFFDAKTQALTKLMQLSKDNHNVIIGQIRDDSKEYNKNVIVLDLPGYGQLSWHTTLNRYGSKEMSELPEYKYEIDKRGGDTYQNINSKILNGTYEDNEINVHNRLVQYVTKGREEELGRLLSTYEHLSKSQDCNTKYRELLDECYEKYGLLSEDNFMVLVDKYFGYEINYDKEFKEAVREWRFDFPEERIDGDPIEYDTR